MAWIGCHYMSETANLGMNVLLFPDVARHHGTTDVAQSIQRNVSQISEFALADALIGYQVMLRWKYILGAGKVVISGSCSSRTFSFGAIDGVC